MTLDFAIDMVQGTILKIKEDDVRQKKIVFWGMFLLNNICFAVPPCNMLNELQNAPQSNCINELQNAPQSNCINERQDALKSDWIDDLQNARKSDWIDDLQNARKRDWIDDLQNKLPNNILGVKSAYTKLKDNVLAHEKECFANNAALRLLRRLVYFSIGCEEVSRDIRDVLFLAVCDKQSGKSTIKYIDILYRLSIAHSTNTLCVRAMDGGVVKNTILASMIPGVWAALKKGPLKNNEAQYTKIIPEFIVKVGSLGTDNVGKKLLVKNEKDDPDVSAFIDHLNRLSHKNDTNAIIRRNKRRYFQVNENIRGVLIDILIAVYYGINIDDICNREESFRLPDPKEVVSANFQKATLVFEQKQSVTKTELSEVDGRNIVQRTTHTINYRVEKTIEAKKIPHNMTDLDFNFINAFPYASCHNSDKQSNENYVLKLLTKSK